MKHAFLEVVGHGAGCPTGGPRRVDGRCRRGPRGVRHGEQCGGSAGGGPDDAGGGDTSNDSLFPDGAFDAPGDQGADASTVTTALFVQASPSLPDVRLCWAPAGVVTGAFSLPERRRDARQQLPGRPARRSGVDDRRDRAPRGRRHPLRDRRRDPRQARTRRGDAVDLRRAHLPQGDTQVPCLRPNLDYWPVAPPTQGGLTSGAPNLVAFSGCLPSALDGNANRAPLRRLVDSPSAATCTRTSCRSSGATPQGAAFSVQAAQLSPAVAALAGDGGAALVSFGGQDAADASTIAMPRVRRGSSPARSTCVLGSDLAVYGQLGFAVTVPDDEGGAGYEWMSLARVAAARRPDAGSDALFRPRADVRRGGAGRSRCAPRVRAGRGRGIRRQGAPRAGGGFAGAGHGGSLTGAHAVSSARASARCATRVITPSATPPATRLPPIATHFAVPTSGMSPARSAAASPTSEPTYA